MILLSQPFLTEMFYKCTDIIWAGVRLPALTVTFRLSVTPLWLMALHWKVPEWMRLSNSAGENGLNLSELLWGRTCKRLSLALFDDTLTLESTENQWTDGEGTPWAEQSSTPPAQNIMSRIVLIIAYTDLCILRELRAFRKNHVY